MSVIIKKKKRIIHKSVSYTHLTVFDRIELIERYATKQEKVIIEFLRTHPIKDLLLFSITEFSEKVGVGDATMLRFCRKLGLRGYSEFRFLLSQSTEDQDGTAGNLSLIHI